MVLDNGYLHHRHHSPFQSPHHHCLSMDKFCTATHTAYVCTHRIVRMPEEELPHSSFFYHPVLLPSTFLYFCIFVFCFSLAAATAVRLSQIFIIIIVIIIGWFCQYTQLLLLLIINIFYFVHLSFSFFASLCVRVSHADLECENVSADHATFICSAPELALFLPCISSSSSTCAFV